MTERADVAVVGGGHNALVAATLLARTGLDVVVLERSDHTGGAAVSVEPFAGIPARLSRYSYLVSLFPQALIDDLGLKLELRSRTTASYSPVVRDGRHTGLLVERRESDATRRSFAELTGSDAEYAAWQAFYAEVGEAAHVLAPSLLEPLDTASDVRDRIGAPAYDDLAVRPIGDVIAERFEDDLVRGVVATDALIGTFASVHDASLVQNRCFLYHLIGNGTGEWRVPVGGMGAVTTALAQAARDAGARLRTGHTVTAVEASGTGVQVRGTNTGGEFAVDADWMLCGAAPAVLADLLGEDPGVRPEGSQLKINLLVDRLPRLRSGVDPAVAFAGTLHLGEGFADLERAYDDAAHGRLPGRQPGEMYCHTLTDPSILGDLAGTGAHTLTYFGVHTPPALFAEDRTGDRDAAVARALAELDEHLEEPIEDHLMRDADGRPCVEAKTPQDLEEALAMPGGHIFHGDLQWPWLADDADTSTPAQRWGVATGHDRVLLCGSGAVRGGAVSGIAGHNAAQALLEARR